MGLDNRNIVIDIYSTFSDNRYRDLISICTYAHAHSVQYICVFNLTYNWFCIWYMIPKLSIFMPISGGLSCQVINYFLNRYWCLYRFPALIIYNYIIFTFEFLQTFMIYIFRFEVIN